MKRENISVRREASIEYCKCNFTLPEVDHGDFMNHVGVAELSYQQRVGWGQ